MVKYNNSKVYKIVSDMGNMVYIGSTTKNYLSSRFAEHRACYKGYKNGTQQYISSYDLFDAYGPENCQIVLLEIHPCGSKDELKLKERYYIELLSCVNKNIPGRTNTEYNNNKCVCDICGGKYNNSGKTLHLRTKKHINAIAAAAVPLDPQLSDTQSNQPLTV